MLCATFCCFTFIAFWTKGDGQIEGIREIKQVLNLDISINNRRSFKIIQNIIERFNIETFNYVQ